MQDNIIDISVVMISYNIERYIPDCIESILAQKGVNFEIICVDDASTDDSLKILLKYQKENDNIVVISNQINAGISSTRSIGAKKAKGKYIYYIDGDDCLKDGALKIMVENMEKYNVDFLGFSSDIFYDDAELKEKCNFDENEYIREKNCGVILAGPEMFSILYDNNEKVIGNLCLYCFKNSFIKENNLYGIEGVRYADDSMFMKYMYAKKVMCIKDVLYRRRYRRNSAVMSPMKRIYIESEVVLLAEEFSCWQKMRLSSKQNQSVFEYFVERIKEIDYLSYLFRNEKFDVPFLKSNYPAYLIYKAMLGNKLLYEDLLAENSKKKIIEADKLVIYGAGYFAEKISDILEYYNKYDYSIVVSKVEERKLFRGKEIKNFEELKEDLTDATIIVAMSKKYKEEIIKRLCEFKTKEVIWFG